MLLGETRATFPLPALFLGLGADFFMAVVEVVEVVEVVVVVVAVRGQGPRSFEFRVEPVHARLVLQHLIPGQAHQHLQVVLGHERNHAAAHTSLVARAGGGGGGVAISIRDGGIPNATTTTRTSTSTRTTATTDSWWPPRGRTLGTEQPDGCIHFQGAPDGDHVTWCPGHDHARVPVAGLERELEQ